VLVKPKLALERLILDPLTVKVDWVELVTAVLRFIILTDHQVESILSSTDKKPAIEDTNLDVSEAVAEGAWSRNTLSKLPNKTNAICCNGIL
jgi:hypothetical protein